MVLATFQRLGMHWRNSPIDGIHAVSVDRTEALTYRKRVILRGIAGASNPAINGDVSVSRRFSTVWPGSGGVCPSFTAKGRRVV